MATTPPAKAVINALAKLRAKLFNNVYNPTNVRTGNKVLRQRLIGPTVTNWYPKQLIKVREITDMFPEFKLVNQQEKQRFEDIAKRKRRGKGAPKKGKGKRATISSKKK
ncbi:mitochondrial ribosomal subunit S27-domain-containing protein [Gigaspora rosea]|uniref:Small ribosomal subunit protein mS33 n=1 Tax=Gigaspora rosea TaxID=44941 RepID=A0A397WAK7_9GLOM|nr:mitochondrial ribosomal subunit S27-domain-containing protein [Gigaspora rosea]CAG8478920.1 19910_t:CDS:2 [Gigaspora rosea]